MRLSGMRIFLAIAVLCLAFGAADGSDTAGRKSLWGRIASPVAGLFRRGRNAVIRVSKVIVWRGRSSTKELEITEDAPPMEGSHDAVREEQAGEEGEEDKEAMNMEVEMDAKPEFGSLNKMDDPVYAAVDPVETEGSDEESDAAGDSGETGETGEKAAFAQTKGSDLKEVEVAGETVTSTEPQVSREDKKIAEDDTRTSTETEELHQEVTAFAASSQVEEVDMSGTSGEVAETTGVLGEAQELVPGTAKVSLPDEAKEGVVESEVKKASAEVGKDGAKEKIVEEKADPTVSEL